MQLVIVHNHFRPGGVRRVVELALPHFVGALRPRVSRVVLLGGEAPDDLWLDGVRCALNAVDVAAAIEPALGYLSGQQGKPGVVERRIRAHLARHLAGVAAAGGGVVWAHNQGLGRNLLLTAALPPVCAELGLPLVLHQHDWWFDNRWARWPEMRRAGFRTLAGVARTIFPAEGNVRHAAINRADANLLQRHLGGQAGWLPNLAEAPAQPPGARVHRARRWLRATLGDDAPVWLVPCRLLRRKNLAEALLLTRWLRPEAWLVTTGGASSAQEKAHADALETAARRHGWRVRWSVMEGGEAGKPSVGDLLAASEAVLLTSLQEGFGLPAIEAAAADRPSIVRRLPNIAPDLAEFGFRFPQAYDDVQVAPALFDWRAEVRRQEQRWRAWRARLPRACRPFAGLPPLLAAGDSPVPVAFSRLTLLAQLEVLAHDADEAWAACARLNPWLAAWRGAAARGALKRSRWPRSADRWLGGDAYARGFARLLAAEETAPSQAAGVALAEEFIRAKLAGGNQYPLLWTGVP